MNKVLGMLTLAFLAIVGGATPVYAISSGPCPSAIHVLSPGDNQPYINNGGLCNVVITFGANGSISTAITNNAPYDGVEDTLVGIVNNSNNIITSISLSSATLALFGFDGDGICSGAFGVSGATNCPHGVTTTDPTDYLGQASSFSGIAVNLQSGTVNFPGIVANGGTSFFSLEEAPSLNFVVNGGVPLPGTFLLLGAGLLGLAWLTRGRR